MEKQFHCMCRKLCVQIVMLLIVICDRALGTRCPESWVLFVGHYRGYRAWWSTEGHMKGSECSWGSLWPHTRVSSDRHTVLLEWDLPWRYGRCYNSARLCFNEGESRHLAFLIVWLLAVVGWHWIAKGSNALAGKQSFLIGAFTR